MITKAKVIDVNGNNAIVRVIRQSACDGCEGCSESGKCHSEIMLSDNNKTYELSVKNPIGANVGDSVEVQSCGNAVIAFAFVIFLLPIVLAVIAYMISDSMLNGIYPIIISAATLIVTFAVLSLVSNIFVARFSKNVICKIIKENS